MRDFLGNGVPNVMVTFTAPNSGASGTFAGSTLSANVETNGAGVATAPKFTANDTAGQYNVTAATQGAAAPATFAITNVAARRRAVGSNS